MAKKKTIYDIFEQKNMLEILSILYRQKSARFKDFENEIKDISPTTLSKRLRDLEKYGIVEKHIYREAPPRIEYVLTSSRQSMRGIFSSIAKLEKKYF